MLIVLYHSTRYDVYGINSYRDTKGLLWDQGKGGEKEDQQGWWSMTNLICTQLTIVTFLRVDQLLSTYARTTKVHLSKTTTPGSSSDEDGEEEIIFI